MPKLNVLIRPVIRRIPHRNLVVRVTSEGLVLRGFRRRSGKMVTWEQIASLSDGSQPIIRNCEEADGRRALERMGAIQVAAQLKRPDQ